MRTIAIYLFEELPEEIQNAIVEHKLYTDWGNYWFPDPLLEVFKDTAKEYGFEDIDISYRGFCSQGDGLSFIGKINIDYFIDKIIKENPKLSKFKIKTLMEYTGTTFTLKRITHHYYHENTVDTYLTINSTQRLTDRAYNYFNEVIDHLSKSIESTRKELCRHFYASLEEDYNAFMDEEVVKEYLIDDRDTCYTIQGIRVI